ncbi:MAG: hypothetical protein NT118_04185 [Lentisphaerae bacterium]|nr:hypothetical protein [Lentisphaerota bacterium]
MLHTLKPLNDFTNPPHKLLGISIHDFRESLDDFRLSENFSKMQPIPSVYKWFEAKAGNTRNIALTATSIKTASCSSAWVFKNYSRWIRTFHVVPSPRRNEILPEYDRDKIEAMSQLDRNGILIDDNEDNVKKAGSCGYTGLLFPRPWNSNAGKSTDDFIRELDKTVKKIKKDKDCTTSLRQSATPWQANRH